MGAWGSSLYANDTTSDVRDTYIDFLKDQLNNQEAYDKTIEQCSDYMNNPDESPLFWYALADTQWQIGRLMPDVKGKAIEWIKKGGGLELWEENRSGSSGWQKTLDKLLERLETEQRKEKKIPKRVDQNLWNIGDMYAYQFHTDESKKYEVFGKYMVLQKMAEDDFSPKGDKIMRVHLFDRLFDKIPTIDEVKDVRLLPLDFPASTRNLYMSTWMMLDRKREYPDKYLTFICSILPPSNKAKGHNLYSHARWNSIESWGMYFQRWQGIEYETIEEGIFRYTRHITFSEFEQIMSRELDKKKNIPIEISFCIDGHIEYCEYFIRKVIDENTKNVLYHLFFMQNGLQEYSYDSFETLVNTKIFSNRKSLREVWDLVCICSMD